MTFAATKGLPKPFVDQAITLAALQARQQQPPGHRVQWLSSGPLPSIERGTRVAQIVNDDLGRAKNLVTAPIAALKCLKHDMIGLRGVMAHADSFMIARVERPAETLFGFDPMAMQKLHELLEGYLNAISQLLGRRGAVAGESPFEIVNNRQQFADKGFLLRGCAALCFLRGPLTEVVEIGG